MTGETVVARAPAKINVHLAVGPLRPDGFHDLRTVYLAVSLYDTVTARPGDGLSLAVTGEGAGPSAGADRVPLDRTNLVWRAAEQRLRAAGIDPATRGEQLSVTDFARLAATDPVAP